MYKLIIIVSVLFSSLVYADASYTCNITRAINADNTNIDFNETKFTVNRVSGVMQGALSNTYITKPVVIDYGSKENSFKAITTMTKKQGVGEGSNIYALTINEFTNNKEKPFVFLENDRVYFGSCIHQ